MHHTMKSFEVWLFFTQNLPKDSYQRRSSIRLLTVVFKGHPSKIINYITYWINFKNWKLTFFVWTVPFFYIIQYTGLPTKDETSETTVRNLYCLFPYIYDSLQFRHVSFLPNHQKWHWQTLFMQKSQINLKIVKFKEFQVLYSLILM